MWGGAQIRSTLRVGAVWKTLVIYSCPWLLLSLVSPRNMWGNQIGRNRPISTSVQAHALPLMFTQKYVNIARSGWILHADSTSTGDLAVLRHSDEQKGHPKAYELQCWLFCSEWQINVALYIHFNRNTCTFHSISQFCGSSTTNKIMQIQVQRFS